MAGILVFVKQDKSCSLILSGKLHMKNIEMIMKMMMIDDDAKDDKEDDVYIG